MTALHGLHHVAMLTTDLDGLLDFYQRVFDAPAVLDGTEDGRRYAMIDVGEGGLLQAFDAAGGHVPLADQPKFQRGRLDHIGFHIPTRDAFFDLRRRLIEAGATDGAVRESASVMVLKFRHSDGMEAELIWIDPAVPLSTLRPYADQRTGQE